MEEIADSEFFRQSAEQINERIERNLTGHKLGVSSFSLREKIALACRMLAEEGHARGLAGQVSIRAEPRETFWTTSFGTGFAETRVSNLLRMDSEMKVLEGEGMLNPAIRFHLWVYGARPQTNCIIHTHPPHASALSMVGEPLIVSHMDAMMFYEDCAYLPNWPGVPVANEEGRIIAEALGEKRSILLAHHGLLTTGKTVEEAIYLAVLLEQAAQLQLRACAVGEFRPVRPEFGREAHDFLLKDSIVNGTFNYWARSMARKFPEALS
jgi:L-fuculose-phosphate aldolase